MVNNNPIGFFDSGVGQLSVLKETKKVLPSESFVIFADQLNNPLGEKTKKQVREFVASACDFLIKKHKIKLMVVACNTASVLGLDYLRIKFKIPIVGTVPAVKTAVHLSKNKRIAIMSTPATAKSAYLTKMIEELASNYKVLKIGCSGLEEAIEIIDEKEIDLMLDRYLQKVKQFNPDVVVLGCTHYPLIKDKICNKLGKNVQVIDSGEAIAKRTLYLLEKNKLKSKKKNIDIFYTTGDKWGFSKTASILLNKKVPARRVQI